MAGGSAALTPTTPASALELIDDRELSRRLGVARITLILWRSRGEGPPFFRVGPRAVRYDWHAVQRWLASRQVGE